MSESLKILALILARGGSTGVKNKNIRLAGGKPLIGWTIEVAKRSKHINRIIVATDNQEIARVGKEFGAEVPIERPSELSGKLNRAYDVYKYYLAKLMELEQYRPDIMVLLFSTSFSKSVEDVDAAIEKLIAADCDWVFTVTECEHHPYRFFTPTEGDRMVNFCDGVPSMRIWGNRQELPPTVRINGNAFVTWTENIENHPSYNIDRVEYLDTDVRYVVSPQERSLDIDTELDFEIADLLLSRKTK